MRKNKQWRETLLVLSLNEHIRFVHIYRRQMGREVEIYDMRAA